MSTEVRPYGARCNLRCHYCYQNAERDRDSRSAGYDLEAIKAGVRKVGGPFSLFGGEPLLMPIDDLEELLRWGFDEFGGSAIQTNGTLITPEHATMFSRWKVRVSISIDGPSELNDARWFKTISDTRVQTSRTEDAIELLCSVGIIPSFIITLHRLNSSPESLLRMGEWLRRLDAKGVHSVRLHILESDTPAVRKNFSLTTAENIAAFSFYYDLEKELKNIRFDVFSDLRLLLMGEDETVACVWKGCDPYTTRAVQAVEGDGQLSNCGRTYKEGIRFLKADMPGFERYVSLYRTPFDDGGCADCRYFFACKGQCPGTALGNDWRRKSEHCGTWMHLFSVVEKELLGDGFKPLSLSPLRREIESSLVDNWQRGENPSLSTVSRAVTVSYLTRSRSRERRHPVASFTSRPARMMWSSESVRRHWAPRITRIRAAVRAVEYEMVVQGDRRAATFWLTGAEADAAAVSAAKRGFAFSVVHSTRRNGSGWSEAGATHFCILGRPDAIQSLSSLSPIHGSETPIAAFGWPACCTGKNIRRWAAGDFDGTWNSHALRIDEGRIEIPSQPLTNTLWRALGLRLLPYVPCIGRCTESARDATRVCESARQLGFTTEIDWLLEILTWPCEWSSNNGIAEIRSEVGKFLYECRSDSSRPRMITLTTNDE